MTHIRKKKTMGSLVKRYNVFIPEPDHDAAVEVATSERKSFAQYLRDLIVSDLKKRGKLPDTKKR